jgi:hypothetical protein
MNEHRRRRKNSLCLLLFRNKEHSVIYIAVFSTPVKKGHPTPLSHLYASK